MQLSSRDFFINMSLCVCIVKEKHVEYPAALVVTQFSKILRFPRAKSTSPQSYGPPTEIVNSSGMSRRTQISCFTRFVVFGVNYLCLWLSKK